MYQAVHLCWDFRCVAHLYWSLSFQQLLRVWKKFVTAKLKEERWT